MKQGKFVRMRRIAIIGDAPIAPKPEDEAALDFLESIDYALIDLQDEGEPDGPFEEADRNYEYAEGTVPYNDYKAANAYAQLGLYRYEPDTFEPGLLEGDEVMTIFRRTLFDFALNTLILVQESDDQLSWKAGMRDAE